MKIILVGQGAFGKKHLDGIKNIDSIEVVGICGGNPKGTKDVAEKYAIPHATSDLEEALALPGVEAAIIASPTQVHAKQAIQCMRAGKHVEIEIPMADTVEDARRIVEIQKETGLVAMAGHTRRFNPSHHWIHNKIKAGELNIQQLDVQTYFFRRSNLNALGQPRSWTDHLLWHHACHTVDLFQYQTGAVESDLCALHGPKHPELGIAMDMSIGLKVPSGAICTLSLSFNNDSPFGSFFRYICDNGTYIASYDDLFDGNQNPIDVSDVDVSMNGIELQDREFFAAIKEAREPNSSVAQALSSMETLDRLEQTMGGGY